MNNPSDLIRYTLHLADNALILGHRNSEWTGHGPILEQDIAISNIALDLIGQARNCYQYAASLIDNPNSLFHPDSLPNDIPITEDHLAYLRDSWDFLNCLLVEQPNGDWACTTLRQFLFSAWQFEQYNTLLSNPNPHLAGIAEKSIKEVTYHLRWSAEWVIRLGDGTPESHTRLENALQTLWKFTGELYTPAPYEPNPDPATLQTSWLEKIQPVFEAAGLQSPPTIPVPLTGGKTGKHTEHLGYILTELQFLQRAYPGCEW